MFDLNGKNGCWTPMETDAWARRAYGRKVMYETEDGTLSATLDQDCAGGFIYLRARISGRMLVEGYCNGVLVFDELVSNEDLDSFIQLPRPKGLTPLEVDIKFIPATFGEVRIPREIEFVPQHRMTAPVRQMRARVDQETV
ncbi:MAG: hypothetical protein P8J02_09005 [Yoonia sp.]|nr:hypothetical protein [Yoonia sp.]